MKVGELTSVKLDLTGGEVSSLMTALIMGSLATGGYPEDAAGYEEYRSVMRKLTEAVKQGT